MKIIDLLNKIANGEDVPKKIKYENIIYIARYYADGKLFEYVDITNDEEHFSYYCVPLRLNDEVEIIEEDKKENEIPNINLDNMKDIGAKVGKAYRELFEGFNKGWNTPLEEEKKIPEKLEDISEIKCVGCKVEINIAGNKTLFDTDTPIVTEHCIYKINQLIKNQKKIIDYLKSKGE